MITSLFNDGGRQSIIGAWGLSKIEKSPSAWLFKYILNSCFLIACFAILFKESWLEIRAGHRSMTMQIYQVATQNSLSAVNLTAHSIFFCTHKTIPVKRFTQNCVQLIHSQAPCYRASDTNFKVEVQNHILFLEMRIYFYRLRPANFCQTYKLDD